MKRCGNCKHWNWVLVANVEKKGIAPCKINTVHLETERGYVCGGHKYATKSDTIDLSSWGLGMSEEMYLQFINEIQATQKFR